MASFSFEQDIILENDRALLRPLQPEDKENLEPIATSDPKLVQYSPLQIHTPELWSAYVDRSLAERRKKIRYPFTVYDKRSGTYAGSSSFGNISDDDRRLEIGWTWIGKTYQGTGLNTTMKALMLTCIFETLEYERIEFRTDERNQASRKALEKLGAKQEGVLRSHMLMPDGFRRYTVYYSILKEEWPAVKEELNRRLTLVK